MKTLITIIICLSAFKSYSQISIYKGVYGSSSAPADKQNPGESETDLGELSVKYVRIVSRSSTEVCFTILVEEDEKKSITECISPEEFDRNFSPVYSRFKGFRTGFYTVPVKLRGMGANRPFDFETDVALQASFIAGFGNQADARSIFDLSFGLGISVISLDMLNSEVTELRTASAFSLSLGMLFTPTSAVNVGVFGGLDMLGRKDQPINWIYNKRPWLGLGINIGLQEITSTKSPKPNKLIN